jgi:hypothetical protein
VEADPNIARIAEHMHVLVTRPTGVGTSFFAGEERRAEMSRRTWPV